MHREWKGEGEKAQKKGGGKELKESFGFWDVQGFVLQEFKVYGFRASARDPPSNHTQQCGLNVGS